MPIQMDWTDSAGTDHAASYWVVELVTFDFKLLQRNVRINAYHSLATFNAADTILTYRDYVIVGAPNYSLTLTQALANLYAFILTDAFFATGSLV